jgi:hypothetical protein
MKIIIKTISIILIQVLILFSTNAYAKSANFLPIKDSKLMKLIKDRVFIDHSIVLSERIVAEKKENSNSINIRNLDIPDPYSKTILQIMYDFQKKGKVEVYYYKNGRNIIEDTIELNQRINYLYRPKKEEKKKKKKFFFW